MCKYIKKAAYLFLTIAIMGTNDAYIFSQDFKNGNYLHYKVEGKDTTYIATKILPLSAQFCKSLSLFSCCTEAREGSRQHIQGSELYQKTKREVCKRSPEKDFYFL